MIEITLTQGKVALIDDEDYALVSQHKWYAVMFLSGNWYAATNTSQKLGKRKILYMHRLIMEAKFGQEIDHKDGDSLNNKRENLQFCTRKQNQWNRHSIKCLGVDKNGNRWRARMRTNGKQSSLGNFATKEEAIEAYQKAAKERLTYYKES
jgi:hypothetical protein